jgi:hypothetical protein
MVASFFGQQDAATYAAPIFLAHWCLSGMNASVDFVLRKSAITFEIRYTLPTCSVPQSGQTPILLGKIRTGGSSGSLLSRSAQTGHLPLSYSSPHFGHFIAVG